MTLAPITGRFITDQAELDEFRRRRRAGFEEQIRCNPRNAGVWVGYARWENLYKDLGRARSVWERAIDATGGRDQRIWTGYGRFEMGNRLIGHARNVFERAVVVLPGAEQLWLEYAFMEEMIGNVDGARHVFERWTTEGQPSGREVWLQFIRFELRYGEEERALAIRDHLLLLLRDSSQGS